MLSMLSISHLITILPFLYVFVLFYIFVSKLLVVCCSVGQIVVLEEWTGCGILFGSSWRSALTIRWVFLFESVVIWRERAWCVKICDSGLQLSNLCLSRNYLCAILPGPPYLHANCHCLIISFFRFSVGARLVFLCNVEFIYVCRFNVACLASRLHPHFLGCLRGPWPNLF